MSGAKRNSMRTIDRQGKAAVRRQCSQEKLRFSREKRDVCGSHGRIDFSFSRASSSVAGSSTHPHPGPLPRERETGTTCRESDVSMRRKKSRIPRGKQHIDPSFFYFLWHAHNKMQKLSGKTTHFENHFATPCISVGAMVQNIREIREFASGAGDQARAQGAGDRKSRMQKTSKHRQMRKDNGRTSTLT